MAAAIATSDARFEYYMAVGRQLERAGERAAATDAYERAGRYGTPSPDGLWSSAGSIIRVRVRHGEATGVFTQVSDGARQLGFKPGDVSFTGRMRDGFLAGRMTLRFPGACYPEGRAVPIIAFMRRDGEALVAHFYNFSIGPDCLDVGPPTVSDTVWNRIIGAR